MIARLMFFGLPVILALGCGPYRNYKITPPPAEPSDLTSAGPVPATTAIKRVLKASHYVCNMCEEEANFFRSNFGENEKVARQAKSLKSIDLTACPKDFQEAFLAQIHALETLD